MQAFNKHRQQNINPSEFLCVDESISRWYGLGGSWIDVGCPHYVVMERKPENGMEIQNVACGRTGIMLGLKLVKSANISNDGHEDDLNAGTKVLLELLRPWSSRPRIVCADSFFASVEAALCLLEIGVFFIGVIKNATAEYPLSFFDGQEMYNKGEWITLFSSEEKDGETYDIAAVCWCDRHRRHFVATTGNVKESVTPERRRWKQFPDGACPTDAGVTMPKVLSQYYEVAGFIDRHNRLRQ